MTPGQLASDVGKPLGRAALQSLNLDRKHLSKKTLVNESFDQVVNAVTGRGRD
jgi:hypothetical protein